MANQPHEHDADIHKGAVEEEDPRLPGQTSMRGQLPHRTENEMIKDSDTDFPEPGKTPEHTGQHNVHDSDADPAELESGTRQKTNQNDKKDDPLAA